MSADVHSFAWLLRHHPEVHAKILVEFKGNELAGARNWRELQQGIIERGAKAERVRCLDVALEAQQRGLNVDETLAAIDSGAPGVSLPPFEALPVRPGTGPSLASSIVNRALRFDV